jgi:hypothetical protein
MYVFQVVSSAFSFDDLMRMAADHCESNLIASIEIHKFHSLSKLQSNRCLLMGIQHDVVAAVLVCNFFSDG